VVDDDSFDLIVFPSPFVAMPGNLIAFSVVQKSFFNKHGVRNAPILLCRSVSSTTCIVYSRISSDN
jgi:hypothetical protein